MVLKIAVVIAASIVLIGALFGDGRGNDRSRYSDVLVVTQDSRLALEVHDKRPTCVVFHKKQ